MLEDIDKIEWKNLTDAYGRSEQIPKILKSMISAHESTCRELELELHELINHQDSIFDSTVVAIPFLIELLANETINCRADILNQVCSIIEGFMCHSELYERKIAGKVGYNDMDLVEQCYAAVAVGYDTYVALLAADDFKLRCGAVRILTVLFDRISKSFPLVIEALRTETHAVGRSHMLTSIHCAIETYPIDEAHLANLHAIYEEIIDDTHTHGFVRLNALKSSVTSGQHQLTTTRRRVLLQVLVEPHLFDLQVDDTACVPDILSPLVSWDYARLAVLRVGDILDAIGIDMGESIHDFASADIPPDEIAQYIKLVERHFSKTESTDEVPFKQQIVIALLLNNRTLWEENKGHLEYLSQFGLPQTFEELKSFLVKVW